MQERPGLEKEQIHVSTSRHCNDQFWIADPAIYRTIVRRFRFHFGDNFPLTHLRAGRALRRHARNLFHEILALRWRGFFEIVYKPRVLTHRGLVTTPEDEVTWEIIANLDLLFDAITRTGKRHDGAYFVHIEAIRASSNVEIVVRRALDIENDGYYPGIDPVPINYDAF